MKKTKNKYTFGRILGTEIRSNLSFGKLIGLIIGGLAMPILFALLPLFISGVEDIKLINNVLKDPSGNPMGTIEASIDAYFMLKILFMSAIDMFIFSRVITAVRDKATVDKNKSAFLLYGKNKVTGSKLITEAIMFIMGFMLLAMIACGGSAMHKSNVDYSAFLKNVMITLPGYLIIYLFLFSVAKWVISYIPKKGVAYAVSIFVVIVLLSPIMILSQLKWTSALNTSLSRGGAFTGTNWFKENQMAVAFIPIMNEQFIPWAGAEITPHVFVNGQEQDLNQFNANIHTMVDAYNAAHVGVTDFKDLKIPPLGTMKQVDELWYSIVPMVYSVAFVAATWTLQSSAQKNYLAAS